MGLLTAAVGMPAAQAQETLLPVRHAVALPAKDDSVRLLPFFDDFAAPAASAPQWDARGVFFNDGYAPWPPTVGMATLDAFDADGRLYPTDVGTLFYVHLRPTQGLSQRLCRRQVPRCRT